MTAIGEPADELAASIPALPCSASATWVAVVVGVAGSASGVVWVGVGEGRLVGASVETGVEVLVGSVVAVARGVLVGAAVGVGMIASTPVGVTRTSAVGGDVGRLTLISYPDSDQAR